VAQVTIDIPDELSAALMTPGREVWLDYSIEDLQQDRDAHRVLDV